MIKVMNNSPDFTAKLDREQRMLVFRMYAEGFTCQEISNEVKARWRIDITREAIRQTCTVEKNLPLVKHFRDAFLAKVREVPIANKRIRIDELEKVRLKLSSLAESTPLKTKSNRQEFLAVVRRLNETISTAREEMENKPNLVAGVVIGDLNDLSDADLHTRKRELIAKALKSVGGGADRPDEGAEGISDPGEEQSG